MNEINSLTNVSFSITRTVLFEKYDLKKSMENFLLFYVEGITSEILKSNGFPIIYRNKETNKPLFLINLEILMFHIDSVEILNPFIKEYKLINHETITQAEVRIIIKNIYAKYFPIGECEIYSTSLDKILKGENEFIQIKGR